MTRYIFNQNNAVISVWLKTNNFFFNFHYRTQRIFANFIPLLNLVSWKLTSRKCIILLPLNHPFIMLILVFTQVKAWQILKMKDWRQNLRWNTEAHKSHISTIKEAQHSARPVQWWWHIQLTPFILCLLKYLIPSFL